jgi:hypothetical protein
MLGAVRRWQVEVGDAYVLGLVRVALGVFLGMRALRALEELRSGYFGDVFHWPLLPEALVASKPGYWVLVIAQLLLAVLVVLGAAGRAALLGSAVLGAYVLLCDRLQFHHNRWALFCYAAIIAFAPCDRSFLLVPRRAAPARVGPLWAARLAQVQLSIIYLASGGSKLLDADWRAGQVLQERFRLFEGQALAAGVPLRVVEALSEPAVTSVLAKLAILTELVLAAGLWGRRTRVPALWWGVCFHLVIEATSRVESFSWLTLAVYGLFVTPDVRARTLLFDPSRATARLAARAVRWLDWFARFEYRAMRSPQPDANADLAAGGSVRPRPSVVVVDRDGALANGLGAVALVARCIPALFLLWGPLALAASMTRARSWSRPPALP